MKILITGGTGFAGSHLVEYLQQHSEAEIHVTSFRDKAGFVADLIGEERVHPIDLTDFAATQKLIQELRPDQIYHLAAYANVASSFDKTKELIQSHITLQMNLLEAVHEFVPHCRILSVGSALAYQSQDFPVSETSILGPDNPYALAKVFQDLLSSTLAKMQGLDIVRVRPFNHIGERQAPGFVVSDFAQNIVKIERGELSELSVGNLNAIRDFSDVKDIVAAYALLMEKGGSGEVYNVGSGKGLSIQQILQILKSFAKTEISVKIDQAKLRPVDLKYLVCDNEKIRELGWQPQHPIEETLQRTLEWWREHLAS